MIAEKNNFEVENLTQCVFEQGNMSSVEWLMTLGKLTSAFCTISFELTFINVAFCCLLIRHLKGESILSVVATV